MALDLQQQPIRRLEEAVAGLSPDLQQAILLAAAETIEATRPIVGEVPRNRQRDVLSALADLLLSFGPPAFRSVHADNVPVEVQLTNVVNHLRGGAVR